MTVNLLPKERSLMSFYFIWALSISITLACVFAYRNSLIQETKKLETIKIKTTRLKPKETHTPVKLAPKPSNITSLYRLLRLIGTTIPKDITLQKIHYTEKTITVDGQSKNISDIFNWKKALNLPLSKIDANMKLARYHFALAGELPHEN